MITLYLTRTGDQTQEEYRDDNSTDKKIAVGKRGFLSVGQKRFHTIERGGGYVMLPEGEFECVMEEQTKRRVFRVKAEGEKGHNVKNKEGKFARILIHSANKPHEVVGCVAPGRTVTKDGVGDSAHAMKEVFQECGGFDNGTTVVLVVKNTIDKPK
jgi:hypothetical protein